MTGAYAGLSAGGLGYWSRKADEGWGAWYIRCVADPEARESPVPLIRLIAGGTAVSAGLGFVLLCVFARLAKAS